MIKALPMFVTFADGTVLSILIPFLLHKIQEYISPSFLPAIAKGNHMELNLRLWNSPY